MKPLIHLTALALFPVPGLVAADTDWLIAPYGWLPGVSVDQTFDDGSGGGTGDGDAEVLSKIDFAVMLRAEAAREHWGAMLDYIYVSLADQTTYSPLPAINIGLEGDLDLEVLELGGFYRLSTESRGADLLLGLRRIDVDLGIVLNRDGQPPRPLQIAAEIDDAFVGMRYRLPLGERWGASLRADYGVGDSDGTLNVIAGVGARFTETFGMKLGYRYANIEFEQDLEGAQEKTDISLSGPFVGLLFHF
jgi:opacity protein-like surface antigen